jgi:hypothetical protein
VISLSLVVLLLYGNNNMLRLWSLIIFNSLQSCFTSVSSVSLYESITYQGRNLHTWRQQHNPFIIPFQLPFAHPIQAPVDFKTIDPLRYRYGHTTARAASHAPRAEARNLQLLIWSRISHHSERCGTPTQAQDIRVQAYQRASMSNTSWINQPVSAGEVSVRRGYRIQLVATR